MTDYQQQARSLILELIAETNLQERLAECLQKLDARCDNDAATITNLEAQSYRAECQRDKYLQEVGELRDQLEMLRKLQQMADA